MTISMTLLAACRAGSDGLDLIHAEIVKDHETVTQLSVEDYLKLGAPDILLLDIRAPEEYAVSHLPNAVQVNPNATAVEILQMGDVTGKAIIVYCSVGRRSSIFAQREQAALMEMGAASVANLEHGIFGWHNETRELVDANGKTDAVHPYDEIWKRYVERDEMARITPVPAK